MTADESATRTRWAPLALLAVTVASSAAMRTVFSPVQDAAKLDLGLSDLRMSLLQGLAAAIPIAIFSFPIGRLTDRSNRTRLLAALAALWTIGILLAVWAPGFNSLFVARMLTGVGTFCAVPVAISISADMSDAGTRGRAMILIAFGNVIGAALAFGAGGGLFGALTKQPLLGLAPWRGVHLVFGIASLALLATLALLREPERHELGEAAGAPLREAIGEVWGKRGLLIPLFIGQVSVVMADVAAGVWAAPVLGRNYHQSPEQFGGWLGLAVLLGGLLGAALGGVAADLGHKSKYPNGILIGAVATALLSIPGAFFPIMPDTLGFGLLLGLLLLCGAATGLITSAALTVLIPNEIRGICLGAFIVVSAVVGLGVAPTLVSVISEMLGGEDQVRYALAATTALTSIVSAIGFALALRGPRKSLLRSGQL
jgi:MFS family permease